MNSTDPLADYVVYFPVSEPFPRQHRPFMPDECETRCRCVASSPEGEYLLSPPRRKKQIEQHLNTRGWAVLRCAPCNEVLFANWARDIASFQRHHALCEFDDGIEVAVDEQRVEPSPTLAVQEFAEEFCDGDLSREIGPRLRCSEVNALTDVLGAAGDSRAITAWFDGHSKDCDAPERHVYPQRV